MKRCELCLGLGYRGRYRRQARGKVWKIENCRACGGRGEVEETRKQRGRRK
jgi:DnaJ-class molecular chaperone